MCLAWWGSVAANMAVHFVAVVVNCPKTDPVVGRMTGLRSDLAEEEKKTVVMVVVTVSG